MDKRKTATLKVFYEKRTPSEIIESKEWILPSVVSTDGVLDKPEFMGDTTDKNLTYLKY